MDTKNCRDCSVELNEANWTPSRQKRYDYICSTCNSKHSAGKTYKRTKRQPKAPKPNQLHTVLAPTGGKVYAKAINLQNRASIYDVPFVCSSQALVPIAAEYHRFKQQKKKRLCVALVGYANGGCICPSNIQLMTSEQKKRHNQQNKVWNWLHKQTYGRDKDV